VKSPARDARGCATKNASTVDDDNAVRRRTRGADDCGDCVCMCCATVRVMCRARECESEVSCLSYRTISTTSTRLGSATIIETNK
jgi:hypothetical protein